MNKPHVLVEDLRDYVKDYQTTEYLKDLLLRAANEIERLRAASDVGEEQKRVLQMKIEALRLDVNRLNADRSRELEACPYCRKNGGAVSPCVLHGGCAEEKVEKLEDGLFRFTCPTCGVESGEVRSLRAELAAYKAAFPHCDKHAPNGSRRSGCLVCGIAELDSALSQIDYLCGDPNEMLCSAYSVHCNPEMVINAVERLRKQLERKA